MTRLLRRLAAVAATAMFVASPQVASAQTWASWTSADPAGVYGTLGSGTVSWVGSYYYWRSPGAENIFVPDAPFTQNGYVGPTYVQLSGISSSWIVFSQPVVNPVIALAELGAKGIPVGIAFGGLPFRLVSDNQAPRCGFTGCGTRTASGHSILKKLSWWQK